jgi:hypothetical protein
MKLFATSLSKFSPSKANKTMIYYTFAMLLNSTDLPTISEHFNHICYLFLSEYENEQFKASLDYINQCLTKLVSREKSLKDAVDELALTFEPVVTEKVTDKHRKRYYEDFEPEAESSDENYSRFEEQDSPFTPIFISICTAATHSIKESNHSNARNQFFFPEIIDHLLHEFMPHCFVWASFALKDYGVTRMSNGFVELYKGFCKSGKKKCVKPEDYLAAVTSTREEHADRYIDEIAKRPASRPVAPVKTRQQLEAELEKLADEKDFHLCRTVLFPRFKY